MQTIDLQEDLLIGCCIDNVVESPIMSKKMIEQQPPSPPSGTTKHQRETSSTPPPPRRRTSLTSRMSNGLRRSSKDLMSSFTKSLPSSSIMKKKKADGSCDDGHQTIPSRTTECDNNNNNNNNNGHQISLSPQSISAVEAAKLVAAEFYATESMDDVGNKQFDELVTLPSLLDASHLVVKGVQSNDDDEEDIRAQNNSVNSCPSTARSSPPPSEEDLALALEVGHSAQEYLEECFYTEVNVLDRQKFNEIPEFSKSDFTIKVSVWL